MLINMKQNFCFKQVLEVTADLRILDQRKRFLLKDKASKPKTDCERQLALKTMRVHSLLKTERSLAEKPLTDEDTKHKK